MDVRNAADTFRVAMAKHPEYDDRFFRFVRDVRVSPGATIAREDSAVWRVTAPGGRVTLNYRIALPPSAPAPSGSSARAAWRAFLTPTVALPSGTHAFIY